MSKEFASFSNYAKVKYSEIPDYEKRNGQAHFALMFLLKNSYTCLNAGNVKEVRKLMDAIRILELKVTIKQNYYPKGALVADNEAGHYEFMLDNFVDDRVDGWMPAPKIDTASTVK